MAATTCGKTEERKSGTWVCIMPEDHGGDGHYFVRTRPANGQPVCPDCAEGKCGVCMGYALDEKADQIVECACGLAGR